MNVRPIALLAVVLVSAMSFADHDITWNVPATRVLQETMNQSESFTITAVSTAGTIRSASVLEIVSITNLYQCYVCVTGVVHSATTTTFRVGPASATLPVGRYLGVARSYDVVGNITNQDVLARAIFRWEYVPSEYTLIDPIIFSTNYYTKDEVDSLIASIYGTDTVARAWATGASNRAEEAYAYAGLAWTNAQTAQATGETAMVRADTAYTLASGAVRTNHVGDVRIEGRTAFGITTTASGANGANANGYVTSATGDYGANANGYNTLASGESGANANGHQTTASGEGGPNANGYITTASGLYGANANGAQNTASGNNGANANGYGNIVSGYNGANVNGINCGVSGNDGANANGYENAVYGDGGANANGLNNYVLGTNGANANGMNNTASGNNGASVNGHSSLAAGVTSHADGYRAKATDDYAFVWADGTDADFASRGPATFNVRATGGVHFVGAVYADGSGVSNVNAIALAGSPAEQFARGDGWTTIPLSACYWSSGIIYTDAVSDIDIRYSCYAGRNWSPSLTMRAPAMAPAWATGAQVRFTFAQSSNDVAGAVSVLRIARLDSTNGMGQSTRDPVWWSTNNVQGANVTVTGTVNCTPGSVGVFSVLRYAVGTTATNWFHFLGLQYRWLP